MDDVDTVKLKWFMLFEKDPSPKNCNPHRTYRLSQSLLLYNFDAKTRPFMLDAKLGFSGI